MSHISTLLLAAQFEEIQFEVEEVLNRLLDPYKVAAHLIEKGSSAKNKGEVLRDLDEAFINQFPTFIARVVLSDTAIPSEIPVLVQKKHYKISGEIWVVHRNDIDPFPSSPHAHNYDQNLVLHLGNGKLYRKRKYVCTAKRTSFLQLRNMITNVQLPPLEIGT